ncbi:MAG: glycerate kinase [Pseudomonadota bacterium]|nr:glycerate kinase [Pseudomonadota bacterium]
MILLAPDSYKGSLTAIQVALAMELGIRRVVPDAQIRLMPLADGGEGTLDAILSATDGVRHEISVTGANFESISSAFGLLGTPDGLVAVLEAAQVVGITLPLSRPVCERTTQGLGEIIRHCLDIGVRRFMIGLGGSSTNDGGSGLLTALGVNLLDIYGNLLPGNPEGLKKLERVDFSNLDPRIAECNITVMSDVNNPLCGPIGATAVFGIQKGVRDDETAELDHHLERFSSYCDAYLGRRVALQPGAGAAGGLGYALLLLGGVSRSGAEVLFDLIDFENTVSKAEWILTGEGRSDTQTLLGKVAFAVSRVATRHNVPVTLLSGGIDESGLSQLGQHFAGCFSVISRPLSLEEAMREAAGMVSSSSEQLMRLWIARH